MINDQPITMTSSRGIGFRSRGLGLVAAIALLLLAATGASAQTTLSFDPAANSVDCGETVDVDVMIDDVTDLRGYSIYFQFDPNVVTVDNAVIGPDFDLACADNYFYAYDPVSGVLRVDASLMGCSLTTTDPKSLMTITLSPGANKSSSTLDLTGSTILRDSGNFPISYTTIAGSIDNICNTAPVVDPDSFDVDENSANGTSVGTVTASDADSGDTWLFSITAGNVAGGFTIDPNSGLITVADTGVLDFETTPAFALTVTATDSDPISPKSGSATIDITLNDLNEAPVLGAIGNQTVAELTQLTFTATATDVDVPPNTLTFTLDAADIALGMAITTGGGFTWTPTEIQGPGSYSATITVSDGILSDSETISIDVSEVNLAPVLDPIGAQVVAEETELAFTATATDADLPANTLTFTLDPADIALGMAITAGGDFTWTPNEAQGPGIFSATITVSDGEGGSAFEAISIDVSEVNAGPVVTDIPDQPIAEGSTFAQITLDDYVSDPDHADDLLSWEATGQTVLIVSIVDRVATITLPSPDWNGSETITFTATDPGTLSGSDDATFSVSGVNDPPSVTNPGNRTSTVLDVISLQIVATDLEDDILSYAATGLPNGLTIDPGTGLISGTIACDAVTGIVQVTVTDDGIPNEATVVSFTWTVDPLAVPGVLTGLSTTVLISPPS